MIFVLGGLDAQPTYHITDTIFVKAYKKDQSPLATSRRRFKYASNPDAVLSLTVRSAWGPGVGSLERGGA